MSKKDYYDALGVSRSASYEEIKVAYRSTAKKCHPDVCPGDAAAEIRFKEISEAYEVLSDDQKRSAYDRYGHAAFENGHGGAGFGGFNFNGGSFADIFEEVFNGFMGGGGNRASSARENLRGNDLRYDLTITLKEAFDGVKKKIDVPTFVTCDKCDGKGGDDIETCATCNGHGRVRRQNGFFMMETPCPTCDGSGKSIKKPCTACKGTGRTRHAKTLEATVPPGVETGVRMRLTGEGEAGLRGGQPGDLYVFITVKENKIFKRINQDLFCDVPVCITTAALGGSIEIPTLSGGKETVKVPVGTQSGHQVKIKGQGMPVLKSGFKGDLYVNLIVETPTNLSKRQRELLRAFEEDGKGKHSPQSSSFWDDVKRFFE